jgi:hypothetical protein
LEGLEVSEISWSALNEELRYEAEFFQKKYLLEDSELSILSKATLGAFAAVTDGPHGYHIVDEHSPIAMLTAKCARDWFSDRTPAETIAASVDLANKRSSLAENDIILSTRGTVGMCALVTKEALPANIDQDVARISWADKESIRPEFVIAYLNSKFGQDRIKRYASGMVQQGLSLQKVRDIPIPLLSNSIQDALALVVQAALKCRRNAGTSIGTAETTLLRALGLENWQATEPLSYARNSRDAFTTGRLDAEYFAPRVSELLKRLGRDCLCIADLAPPRRQRFKPAREGQFDYIEIGGLRQDGTAEAEQVLQSAAPSRATQMVDSGDVITSTVRPIRRLSALIAPEQNGFVCSSGFVVLQPEKIAPEVLLTYLRLKPVCELMDLHTSASLYPAISEQDLLALPIPRIDQETQRAVSAAVQAAQQSRQRATQLLDAAKRAVEIAIEDSEAAALAYLEGINP